MWPNPQFPADLVTFTEENLNGKLKFFCSVTGFSSHEIYIANSMKSLSNLHFFNDEIFALKKDIKILARISRFERNVTWVAFQYKYADM